MINAFAWIRWNVDRELFHIPYFHLSVGWYGVLFAIGFLIGYYLFIYLCRRLAFLNPHLLETDLNWNVWEREISSHPEIRAIFGEKLFETSDRKALLAWLNEQAIEKGRFDRQLFFDKRKTSRFLCSVKRFFKSRLSPEDYLRLKRRLSVEELFGPEIINTKKKVVSIADRFLIYLVIATVVGARGGHIFFYEDWTVCYRDPLFIFRVWEGGLASHGGVLAVLVTIFFFYRFVFRRYFPHITPLMVFDTVGICTVIEGFFIRMGNFFNQEIVGIPTNVPWAIIFSTPMNEVGGMPRHPAQLYEAFFYLIFGCMMFYYWRSNFMRIKPGRIGGICLFGAFLFRFFVEGLKPEQSQLFSGSSHFLLMGQYLSIPLVFLGIVMIFSNEIYRWLWRRH